jgi:DNA invertase Pin-like site-specific DNA recombinase
LSAFAGRDTLGAQGSFFITMEGYIGYIRVSTVKQGTTGVSLLEQRDAISRYAERNQLPISIWFEEMETAAKQGRPEFTRALKLLRAGKARGIILHKLDRGARNLRDWAAIGELSDKGVQVHFVTESLDLQSRGGRLSADIQAVVAADYIRNLREETRKGFYGRLKQGLYPLRAPIGYLDHGKGKPKTIDPTMGPLTRQTFELYSTAKYCFETLGEEMYRRGLRNKHGGRVTKNGLSTLLNNPFYIGLMRIEKTNEVFPGVHEPLVRRALFDRVQAVLAGKVNARTIHHNLLFRRLLTCATCQYSLIGERQKGHIYYRCHTKACPQTSVREESVSSAFERLLRLFQFADEEKAYFKTRIFTMRQEWTTRIEDEIRNLRVTQGQIKDRLNRLTDAYLDQAIDKAMFEERKRGLLFDQKDVEQRLTAFTSGNHPSLDRVEKFLELLDRAWLTHQTALTEEKRENVSVLTSNRVICGKSVVLEPSIPFDAIANRAKTSCCDPHQDTPRTVEVEKVWEPILKTLSDLNSRGALPDLSGMVDCGQHEAAEENCTGSGDDVEGRELAGNGKG